MGGLAACTSLLPSDFEERIGDEPAVLVKRVRIPSSEPWYSQFASHCWFEVRETAGGTWRRVEMPTPTSGVRDTELGSDVPFADERWGREVSVLRAAVGPGAGPMAAAIRELAASYDDETYRAWPGPNSNTFVEHLLRDVPRLDAALDHNSVGRDWAAPVQAGLTGTGLGVDLELPLLGVQVGLVEGAEVHFIGLAAGVGLWPLSLKLPCLPALQLTPTPDPLVRVE